MRPTAFTRLTRSGKSSFSDGGYYFASDINHPVSPLSSGPGRLLFLGKFLPMLIIANRIDRFINLLLWLHETSKGIKQIFLEIQVQAWHWGFVHYHFKLFRRISSTGNKFYHRLCSKEH
jgi:hypothetical protein